MPPLQPGAIIGGHRIVRILGAGGSGTVYLARHPRLNRDVALKVINDSHVDDREVRAAFDRETELVAGLNHANIIDVYDRNALDDPTDANLWLSMRYIAGGDLTALITAAPEGLPPDRAVELITDIARGLDHAHTHGIMHRDVKPGNVLLDGDRAVLTDFGIARALGSTVTATHVAASLHYAAPERFRREAITNRSDIYSLGATLYHLLTGRVPFPVADPAALIHAHLQAGPPAPTAARPNLSDKLDHVITVAMAKDPDDRYPTCLELATHALRAITSTAFTATALASPVSAPHHQLQPERRMVTRPVVSRKSAKPKRSLLEASVEMFYSHQDKRAEAALCRDAKRGDARAMLEMGRLEERRGDLDEAEQWYRRAASQYGPAMRELAGFLVERRGDLDEAEEWLRCAVDTDSSNMVVLADFLVWRGDPDEAEQWYRRAARRYRSAMGRLAGFLEKHRDLDEAEIWYRRSVDCGFGGDEFGLARLLERRGKLDEAEVWYRRVADRSTIGSADEPHPMSILADLLEERGKHAEAETWRRKRLGLPPGQ